MQLFASLFAPPVRPILLRLKLGGQAAPAAVEVETRWLPSNERVETSYLSSSSMVLVPWRGTNASVAIVVRCGEHEGRAVATRESNQYGEALDVPLTAAVR